ncbi:MULTISPECIES: DUF4190 domain-containing protein [Streptomyces]|uniref:DUF4190 domain-containing protein n=1 Tax=Streptomyces TaxID=1883 RepID=UPI00224923F8|nr:DUF4190 domain-containing protein [Streptomyces sp. JHD 1]MCX2967543.1 DUF4190 domain-containing protein [Streptomyces sp. JHD 1]
MTQDATDGDGAREARNGPVPSAPGSAGRTDPWAPPAEDPWAPPGRGPGDALPSAPVAEQPTLTAPLAPPPPRPSPSLTKGAGSAVPPVPPAPSPPPPPPAPAPPVGGYGHGHPYAAHPHAPHPHPHAAHPYAPPRYGYGGYPVAGWAPPATPPTSGICTAAMVLGIVGTALSITIWGGFVGIVCCPVAIGLAVAARKRVDRGAAHGSGQATAGLVLGIIGTVLSALFVTLLLIGLSGGFDEEEPEYRYEDGYGATTATAPLATGPR